MNNDPAISTTRGDIVWMQSLRAMWNICRLWISFRTSVITNRC